MNYVKKVEQKWNITIRLVEEAVMARGRKPAKIRGVFERPPGSGIWCVRYKINGIDVKKTLGSRSEAVAYLEKLRTVRRSGDGFIPATAKEAVMTRAEKAERISSVTVAELCDDLKVYIAEHPSQYKDQINPPRRLDRIKANLGDRVAARLKPKDIETWLDGLTNGHAREEKGKLLLADATVNRYRVMLSAVYKRGIKNEKVSENPVKGTSQRRLKNGIIRWLKPEEEKAVRAALQERIEKAIEDGHLEYANHQRHHLCEFIISLKCGMRKGEQYGLEWPEVDFKLKQVHVKESKNGTERYIPMLPEVVWSFKVLKSMALTRKDRSEEQPNQSSKDCCFALADPKKWWTAVLKEAKVKKYRWHDNRHTFCSRLVQAGKSLKIVQELAGHRDIKMTARYAHLDQGSKREALEDAFRIAA